MPYVDEVQEARGRYVVLRDEAGRWRRAIGVTRGSRPRRVQSTDWARLCADLHISRA